MEASTATKILRNPEVRKWAGINPGERTKKLGEGYYGVAYLLPNDRVLKITSDSTERRSASFLLRKSNARIAKIFKVADVTVDVWDEWAERYFTNRYTLIIQEYIPGKLTKREAEIVQAVQFVLDNYYENCHIDLFRTKKWTMRKWNDVLDWVDWGYTGEFWHYHFIDHLYDKKNQDFIWEILLTIQNFQRHGITWTDLHDENVRRKSSGKLAAFDIGCTTLNNKRRKDIPIKRKFYVV